MDRLRAQHRNGMDRLHEEHKGRKAEFVRDMQKLQHRHVATLESTARANRKQHREAFEIYKQECRAEESRIEGMQQQLRKQLAKVTAQLAKVTAQLKKARKDVEVENATIAELRQTEANLRIRTEAQQRIIAGKETLERNLVWATKWLAFMQENHDTGYVILKPQDDDGKGSIRCLRSVICQHEYFEGSVAFEQLAHMKDELGSSRDPPVISVSCTHDALQQFLAVISASDPQRVLQGLDASTLNDLVDHMILDCDGRFRSELQRRTTAAEEEEQKMAKLACRMIASKMKAEQGKHSKAESRCDVDPYGLGEGMIINNADRFLDLMSRKFPHITFEMSMTSCSIYHCSYEVTTNIGVSHRFGV